MDQWPSFNEQWLAEHYPDRLNCAVELLDGTISCLGGAGCAVTDGEESWTYDELADRVQRTANVLVALGVVPGNRVLLRGPNNPWLAVTWLAVIRIGAVVVTTMPLLRTGELEKIVDIAQVQFALVDHRFVEEWSGVANFAGLTLIFGGADPADLEHLVAEASNVNMPVDTAADDVCMLAFTSGTTGKPKATMHFHRDVLAIADSFCASIVQPTAADIFAGSPPFAFTFGLGALLIFPLRFGACALLLESASPPILLRTVELNRVTCLFTAPTAYRAMLPSVGEVDLSSLRVCISAGETLPEPTWRAWKQATGQSLIDGIGATEMLHVFISARGDEIVPGSTGKAVPGYIADVVE
ncbi:MAG: AMP-binding protein, partial [Actinobacteria bacterium]|nr:AMP-binding protein [Actinomycetota bacterium]